MNKNQKTNEQIKEYILETVKKQKPENAQKLIALVQQSRNLTKKEITRLLIQLENEKKLSLRKEKPTVASFKTYVFSSNSAWYWITITLAAATAIAVFTIREDAYPLVYARQALGIAFVLFLPGYTFVKTLFPTETKMKTSSENIDSIIRIALSIGMSLALVPIIGLILNYTPWGIRLTPITLSLLALTTIFATAALLREHQQQLTVRVEQVSESAQKL